MIESKQEKILKIISESRLTIPQLEEFLGVKIKKVKDDYQLEINSKLVAVLESILEKITDKSFAYRVTRQSELKILKRFDLLGQLSKKHKTFLINDIISLYLDFKILDTNSLTDIEVISVLKFLNKQNVTKEEFSDMASMPINVFLGILSQSKKTSNNDKEKVLSIVNATKRFLNKEEIDLIKNRIHGDTSNKIKCCNQISVSKSLIQTMVYSIRETNPFYIGLVLKKVLVLTEKEGMIKFNVEQKRRIESLFMGKKKENNIIAKKLGYEFDTMKSFYNSCRITLSPSAIKEIMDKVDNYIKENNISVSENIGIRSFTEGEIKSVLDFKKENKFTYIKLAKVVGIPSSTLQFYLKGNVLKVVKIKNIMSKIEGFDNSKMKSKSGYKRVLTKTEIELIKNFKVRERLNNKNLSIMLGLKNTRLIQRYLKGDKATLSNIASMMKSIENINKNIDKNKIKLGEIINPTCTIPSNEPTENEPNIDDVNQTYVVPFKEPTVHERAIIILSKKEGLRDVFLKKIKETRAELKEMEDTYFKLYYTEK